MNYNRQATEVESTPSLHSYVDHLRHKGWRLPPVLHTRKVAGDVIIGRDGLIWV